MEVQRLGPLTWNNILVVVSSWVAFIGMISHIKIEMMLSEYGCIVAPRSKETRRCNLKVRSATRSTKMLGPPGWQGSHVRVLNIQCVAAALAALQKVLLSMFNRNYRQWPACLIYSRSG
jgi:hypothetical protein